MKTKKVSVPRTSAAFSTAIPSSVVVTLPRCPWDTEPDAEVEPTTEPEDRKRAPRHLGPYKKRQGTK